MSSSSKSHSETQRWVAATNVTVKARWGAAANDMEIQRDGVRQQKVTEKLSDGVRQQMSRRNLR